MKIVADPFSPDVLQEIVDAETDAQILLGVANEDLTVMHANHAARSVFNLQQLAKGRTSFAAVLPDSAQGPLVSACLSVWSTGRAMNLDDLAWSQGDRRRWVDVRVRRLYGRISVKCLDVTERHRAREQLKESQAHYRLLAEYSSDVVFASADGILTWVSPSVKSVLGWRPSEMVEKHIAEFIHPEDVTLMAGAATGVDAGHPARYEARFKHLRGNWVWLAITARPQYDDHGRVTGRIGSGRDISARIAAERALQESERHVRQERESLRALLDSSLDPQVVLAAATRPDGTILDFEFTDCNAAAAAYLRTPRRDLIGRRLAEMFPGPTLELTSAWMRQVVATGKPFVTHHVELFPSLAGGEQRWFDISITRLASGVSFTWRDVTAAVMGSKALARSEELFRLTAENSPVALCLIAPDGGFITVNRALCELLGRDEAAVRDTTWQQLTHPEDLNVDLDLVADVLAGRRDSYRLTKRYLRPDGSVVWGDLSVSCVRDADGQVRHFISQIVDITELVQQRHALAESEKHYRLLAENTADVVATISEQGLIEWVSPSVATTVGWDPADLLGRSISDFVEPQDWRRIEAIMAGNRPGMQMHGAFRARRRDGSYAWVDATAMTTAGPDGRILRVARLRDVDREFRAQQRLRASEERFRTAMNSSPVGTALVNADGKLVQVNDALCDMLGFTADELLGRDLGDLGQAPQGWEQVLRGQVWVGENQLTAAHGHEVWVQQALASVVDDDGVRSSVVAQFIDVTAARQARGLLEFQANHDPLTGLKNRRAMLAALATTLSQPPRHVVRLAVLYCDLDGFKPINDRFGHAVGDEVLEEVARRIRRCVRTGDIVSRIGGDEFVVLLMDLQGHADARSLAERVRVAVARPISANDHTLTCSISIGVALADAGEDADDVLARADRALYAAKERGRNRVVCDDL